DRQAATVDDAAAVAPSGIAADDGVDDRHRAANVVDAAAFTGDGLIEADGGIDDNHRAAVFNAATVAGGRVTADGRTGQCQCAMVVNAAAEAPPPPRDGQAGDLHRYAGADREDLELGRPSRLTAGHGQNRGPGAGQGDV